jgi:hypothetical protein
MTRNRLYAWRIDLEIRVLRWITTLLRAVRQEDWRALLVLCAAAWLAGLIVAVAALALMAY